MTRRRNYVVAYDIADDKRRTEVFKTLRDFGNHVQYSVFFCELVLKDYIDLRERLRSEIDHGKDQILFVDMGSAESRMTDQVEALGKPYVPPGRRFVV